MHRMLPLLAAVLAAALAVHGAAGEAPVRPNILLTLSDHSVRSLADLINDLTKSKS